MSDVITVDFLSIDHHVTGIECDSVRLPIADNIKGEFSGSYGIRKGHAKAVFLLKAGSVVLTKDNKTVFSADISDGFATIENNNVVVTVNNIT